MTRPTLIITHESDDGVPYAGKCSSCGHSIAQNEPPSGGEDLEAAFQKHVDLEHEYEDYSK